jgi:hypothetical protein
LFTEFLVTVADLVDTQLQMVLSDLDAGGAPVVRPEAFPGQRGGPKCGYALRDPPPIG